MVVPVHHLECVPATVIGLEVVVKYVSTNLSQMGAGQHVMHLALSYSFLYSLYVYTAYYVHMYYMCVVCTMSTVTTVCTVHSVGPVCIVLLSIVCLSVLCVLYVCMYALQVYCVYCVHFMYMCILHVLNLCCSVVMNPQCFIIHQSNPFSLTSQLFALLLVRMVELAPLLGCVTVTHPGGREADVNNVSRCTSVESTLYGACEYLRGTDKL